MVRNHTYFLARRAVCEGALKDNEAITQGLAALYEAHKGEGEASIVDGASAWIDANGAVQSRVIASGVARAVELAPELATALLSAGAPS